MEYLKGHLPLDAQAEQLLDRVLIAGKDELILRLAAVSYYRLSGYLFPFREADSDNFRPGTELRVVWDRYCFDRRLRVLLLDAIERVEVAGHFGMPDEQLLGWLRGLYAARNICAHHSRIWNRILGYAPGLPQKNKHPEWHLKDEAGKSLIVGNRTGMVIILCHQFLKLITPTSCWQQRVNELFAEYPEIPLTDMGLTADWQNHPLWKS